jgi:hypothetical protein
LLLEARFGIIGLAKVTQLHILRRVVAMPALLCFSLFISETQPASAQPANAPSIVVTASESGPRVTVTPGVARCRTVLSELARLGNFEIRNLSHVPETDVYVDFSAAPLVAVVSKILEYARVDFVLVGRGPAGLSLAAVFDRGATNAPNGALQPPVVASGELPGDSENLPIPPQVHLPPIEPSSAADMPSGRPLDVRPEIIQIEGAPTWQPVDMTPKRFGVPLPMTPRTFPVAAPPPTTARPPSPPGGR